MSLPIYQRVAVTDAGDVIPGAEYTVINENTGVAAPIYSDRTGATLLTAPYFANSVGVIQFYIAQGTTFRVAASGGVGTYTDRYVYGVAGAVLTDVNGSAVITSDSTDNWAVTVQNGTQANAYGLFVNAPSTTGIPFRVDSAGSERLRITPAGNVGIGTSSPDKIVDIVNSSTPTLRIGDDVRTVELRGGSTTQNPAIGTYYGGDFTFATNSTERMRIDSSGHLLIGFTSRAYSERVSISMTSANQGIAVRQTDGSGANDKMLFVNTNGIVGYIRTTGSSTAYSTASDYRLKEDDIAMTGATERVKALRPINFAWKADGTRTDGFFAHEVQEVVPEAAQGTKDAMMDQEYEVTPAVYEDVITPAVEAVLDENGVVITEAVEESTESVLITEAVMGTRSVPDYQGIDQAKLVPLLTATIQELIARIEALEGE